MKDEIKEKIDDIFWEVKKHPMDSDYLVKKEEMELLLDYITNLQDELYSTNQVVKELLDVQEENEKNKKYSDFYKDMSNKWKDLLDVFKKDYYDYKSRNEKAIEYIKENKSKLYMGRNDFTCEIQYSDEVIVAKELSNILQGEDKDA